jgi:FG-GAP repeat
MARAGAGSATIWIWITNHWSQEAAILPSGAAVGGFGSSIALSESGNVLAVGAPGVDATGSGAVLIFLRTGTHWAQDWRMTAATPATGDQFGAALSLNAEGTMLAVGAPGAAGGAGAVTVFARTGDRWAVRQNLTSQDTNFSPGVPAAFGSSVSIPGVGTQLLVGEPGLGLPGLPAAGAVDLFNVVGSAYREHWEFRSNMPVAYARLGASVSTSDAVTPIVAGAPGDGGGRGYVYVFSGTVTGRWAESAVFTGSNVTTGQDSFGSSVQLSRDGGALVVGDPGYDGGRGSMSVLLDNGPSSWSRLAVAADPTGAIGDGFGSSVAASNVPGRFAVGAPGDGTGKVVDFG